jgi:hypothetical protein
MTYRAVDTCGHCSQILDLIPGRQRGDILSARHRSYTVWRLLWPILLTATCRQLLPVRGVVASAVSPRHSILSAFTKHGCKNAPIMSLCRHVGTQEKLNGFSWNILRRFQRILKTVYNTRNRWVFFTFPIIRYSKKNTKQHNVSETGSVSVLRWIGKHLLCWVR